MIEPHPDEKDPPFTVDKVIHGDDPGWTVLPTGDGEKLYGSTDFLDIEITDVVISGSGIDGVPKEHRQTIAEAITKRYPKQAQRIFNEGHWDGLSSYFGFYCNNMYLGCETDGHIHS